MYTKLVNLGGRAVCIVALLVGLIMRLRRQVLMPISPSADELGELSQARGQEDGVALDG